MYAQRMRANKPERDKATETDREREGAKQSGDNNIWHTAKVK